VDQVTPLLSALAVLQLVLTPMVIMALILFFQLLLQQVVVAVADKPMALLVDQAVAVLVVVLV
jgi:hypothetical protein